MVARTDPCVQDEPASWTILVVASPPEEPHQDLAARAGQIDGEGGRGPDGSHHGDARDERFLDDLEARAAADHEDAVVHGHAVGPEPRADHLVHGVVAADVLPEELELALPREETGGVEPSRLAEHRLVPPEPVGERHEHGRIRQPRGSHGGCMREDAIDAGLAAHPAARAREQGTIGFRSPACRDAFREHHVHGVPLRVGGIVDVAQRAEIVGPVDDPLGVEEARDEIEIVARRPHRHGDGRALDPDLERLLDRHDVPVANGALGRDPPEVDRRGAEWHGCNVALWRTSLEKGMRPRVIVHNSVSIDGALAGFDLDLSAHFGALGQLAADAILMGANTAIATIEREAAQPGETDEDTEGRDLDPADPRFLWFIPDPTGRLQGQLHFYRRFELCKDIVVLGAASTPQKYRSWLAARNYRFHSVGKDEVDLAEALPLIGKEYGVKRVVTDGGPGLVGALLAQSLVDELSLLVFPNLVAAPAHRLFEKLDAGTQLDLEDAWALENGAIHLRWTVRR
jgi:2,5-diamino-6-(ribosylamino)-4(3H)-pyrimidinone 5'-phosphate reductase